MCKTWGSVVNFDPYARELTFDHDAKVKIAFDSEHHSKYFHFVLRPL